MNAEPVAPLADESTGEETPPKARRPMKRCTKCGKWKFYTTERKTSEYPYYARSNTWSSWCKKCYGDAAAVGSRMRKSRRMGDQAGAIIPGEGELQRSVRRGDTLMSVSEWMKQGVGALVLLSGEAVYQFETRDDGIYVHILRRAPLTPLTPVAIDSFLHFRSEEEGVFYR